MPSASLAFNASPDLQAPSGLGGWVRFGASLAAWQCAVALLLVSLTIPDAVLHAKVYKLGLIVRNVHQRYFDQT